MTVKVDEPNRDDEERKQALDDLANGSAHFTPSSHSDLDDLREARHKKDEWDKQIEEDAKAGNLDELIQEARRDHRQGNTQPLP